MLYLRFFHPPLHMTGVAIARPTPTACEIDVTGRISTSGAAGTFSTTVVIQFQ